MFKAEINANELLLENYEDAQALMEIVNRAKTIDQRFMEIDGELQYIYVEQPPRHGKKMTIEMLTEAEVISQKKFEELRKLRDTNSSDAA